MYESGPVRVTTGSQTSVKCYGIVPNLCISFFVAVSSSSLSLERETLTVGGDGITPVLGSSYEIPPPHNKCAQKEIMFALVFNTLLLHHL